ncbi:hypothetical protein PAEPH01_1729 [Pancytospora epiphaga]|nr:hypothetical protein PAEPH01_1729 [Pancytospora epiphaga]
MGFIDDFLKKKRQVSAPKTINIRMVQEALGVSMPAKCVESGGDLNKGSYSVDAMKDEYLEKTRASNRQTEKAEPLDGFNKPSRIPKNEVIDSKILKNNKNLEQANIYDKAVNNEEVTNLGKLKATKDRVICTEKGKVANGHAAVSETIKDRRVRIENFATRKIDIEYSLINLNLYLPKEMKKVGELFKILETTYKFNQKRNLSLVLVKYKDSIERLFKHRLDDKYLEQLNFIAGEYIEYLPVTLMDKGMMVKSVTIIIKEGANIDKMLYEYFIGEYKRWCIEVGIERHTKTIHPDFKADGMELPRKEIEAKDEAKTGTRKNDDDKGKAIEIEKAKENNGSKACNENENDKVIDKQSNNQSKATEIEKTKAKEIASSIYERIKEKERLRKEAFKKEQVAMINYIERIDCIFATEGKRAIRLSELIFQFGDSFGSNDKVLNSLNDKYYIKKFDGVEYVVKQGK